MTEEEAEHLAMQDAELKTHLRWLRRKTPWCQVCRTRFPEHYFSEYELKQWWNLYSSRMIFGVWRIYEPQITCKRCEFMAIQRSLAKDAMWRIRRRALLWWLLHTGLTKSEVTEDMIQVKIAEIRLKHLWQLPQI